MVESAAHWNWRFNRSRRISLRFWSALLRGRRSIWWGWRVMPVAPRIVNDVPYVTKINHESHFAWQAQYLVRLQGDACCSAHCKWRFRCHGYRSWESFFVAGAVFGDFGVSRFAAGAVFGEVRVDSRLWSCFSAKLVAVDGLARMLLWVSILFCHARHQPTDLGRSCYFTELCDEDQSWESFCVAGAVFGEVGGRCLLLRAL